jgi:hypothetical protein
MAASREDLSRWFDRGIREGASHMIVAVDQFEWDDYPVYVDDPAQVPDEVARIRSSSMQDVMEVYDLRADKAAQMLERRAWRVPA